MFPEFKQSDVFQLEIQVQLDGVQNLMLSFKR